MSLEQWRAAVAAARPAPTAAQLSALRPLGQQMAASMRTAPAGTGAALTAPLQETGVTE